MGMDVYLEWDGGSYQDRQGVMADWYDAPFESGHQGQLDGHEWQSLFIEAYRASETREPMVAVSSAVLFRRLPSWIFEQTEEVGPGWFDDYYWKRRTQEAMGFLLGAAQLEAEGLNPKIRMTW